MSTGVAAGPAGIAPGPNAGSARSTRLAAYAVAAVVHLGTLVVVALAVILGVSAVHHVWGFVIVALLLALAWLMRPRLGSVPAEGLLTRAEAPTIYGLCDDVARAYGRRTVDFAVIDSRFGAAASSVGLRRRRVIVLGLPLVAALLPQARVALVASQLAPEKSRGAQSVFVRSAMGALDEWCKLFAPHERKSIWTPGVSRSYASGIGGAVGVSGPIANAIVWLIGRPAVWLLRLETRLVSRDLEPAAYRADLQAAEVAGKSAMIDLYEHVRTTERFLALVQQEARAGRDGLLSRITAVAEVPSKETGGGRPSGERLAEGEPPTEARIQLLEQQGSTTAEVVLDSSRSTAIDREVEVRANAVEGDLYDWYRSSIYR